MATGVAWLPWIDRRPVWVLLFVFLAALAFACHGAGRTNTVEDQGAAPPASSAERATARAQREARNIALDEQGDRPKPTAESEEVEAPKPPPPEPPPPTVASATPPEVVDAGVADGAVDATTAAVDAGPMSLEALCQDLCARAIACALEMVESSAGGLDPDMVERMQEQMRASEIRCREECASGMDSTDESRMATAEKCLAEEDCETFLTCMREVLDE